MMAASFQTCLVAFAACYGSELGLVGALGFYHITQPAAARMHPRGPNRAIVWLTILGSVRQPNYLPLTAGLVQLAGWRGAVRVEAVNVAVAFLIAAAVVDARQQSPGEKLGRARDAFATAWRSPAFCAWIAASFIGGAAADVMLVYQVAAMIAAGLPIMIAAVVAGVRGFAQLAGRIALRAHRAQAWLPWVAGDDLGRRRSPRCSPAGQRQPRRGAGHPGPSRRGPRWAPSPRCKHLHIAARRGFAAWAC